MSLVAQDAMTDIPEIADFISNMKELIAFIRASAKRLNIFKNIQLDQEEDEDEIANTNRSSTLKLFCPTRWCARVEALRRVDENYQRILKFCEETSLDPGEGGIKARGFLTFLTRFETLILLKITTASLERVEALNETLQATSINFKSVIRRVELLKSCLNELRSDDKFDEIWSNCCTDARKYELDEPILPR